jgi:hypothetical protein
LPICCCLIRSRVDDGQHVAGLHVLAFGEQHAADPAIHLRLDVDGVVGLHGADAGQVDRHLAGAGGGDHHGHRGRRRRRRGQRRRGVQHAVQHRLRQHQHGLRDQLEIQQRADDEHEYARRQNSHAHRQLGSINEPTVVSAGPAAQWDRCDKAS